MKTPLVLAAFVLAAQLPAQNVSVVSGTVRDENGAPVREAMVAIDPDSLNLRARTSADGRYRIFAVPRGRYEVRVARIGFRPLSQRLDISNDTVTFDVQLRLAPLRLDQVTVRVSRPGLYGRIMSRGIELLPHEPTPVRSANVAVLNEPHRVKSDGDGRFSIPELAIGSHTILVALDHYVTRMIPITVPAAGGIDVTITLDSLNAEYQRWDDAENRLIAWRIRNARSPATFVSGHELDSSAKDMREALKFAPSVFLRGINLMETIVPSGQQQRSTSIIVYINGKLTNIELQDLALLDLPEISGVEVYPAGTLLDELSLPGSSMNIGKIEDGKLFGNSQGPRRSRGNVATVIMIWTTKRR